MELGPVQTRLTPTPGCPPGVRTYSYQNQDAPRSGARPAAPRPVHNSGSCQRSFFRWRSSVLISNLDSGKTRSAVYRCSQTRPPTAELPHGYVVRVLATLFLRSSGKFNTDPACRTGVLVRRLPVSNGMDAPGQSGIECARVESARPTTMNEGSVQNEGYDDRH